MVTGCSSLYATSLFHNVPYNLYIFAELIVPAHLTHSELKLVSFPPVLFLVFNLCFICLNRFLSELILTTVADERKKLDGFMMCDTGNPQDMKKSATILWNKEPEPKYNVRQSLAWDSAFFTSPGVCVCVFCAERNWWFLVPMLRFYIFSAQTWELFACPCLFRSSGT